MAEVKIESLKPNSHRYQREQEERQKLNPIVKKENVVQVKKSLGKKLKDSFIKGDVQDVKNYILFDFLIPELQNGFLNAVSLLLFKETYDVNRGKPRCRSSFERTSYGSYYGDSRRTSRKESDREEPRVDYRNIILRYREDAENVIDTLRERIRKDGYTTIAELLDLVQCSSSYVDNNWGWDDERDIGIRKVSNSGYLIDVAKAKYLR